MSNKNFPPELPQPKLLMLFLCSLVTSFLSIALLLVILKLMIGITFSGIWGIFIFLFLLFVLPVFLDLLSPFLAYPLAKFIAHRIEPGALHNSSLLQLLFDKPKV